MRNAVHTSTIWLIVKRRQLNSSLWPLLRSKLYVNQRQRGTQLRFVTGPAGRCIDIWLVCDSQAETVMAGQRITLGPWSSHPECLVLCHRLCQHYRCGLISLLSRELVIHHVYFAKQWHANSAGPSCHSQCVYCLHMSGSVCAVYWCARTSTYP